MNIWHLLNHPSRTEKFGAAELIKNLFPSISPLLYIRRPEFRPQLGTVPQEFLGSNSTVPAFPPEARPSRSGFHSLAPGPSNAPRRFPVLWPQLLEPSWLPGHIELPPQLSWRFSFWAGLQGSIFILPHLSENPPVPKMVFSGQLSVPLK